MTTSGSRVESGSGPDVTSGSRVESGSGPDVTSGAHVESAWAPDSTSGSRMESESAPDVTSRAPAVPGVAAQRERGQAEEHQRPGWFSATELEGAGAALSRMALTDHRSARRQIARGVEHHANGPSDTRPWRWPRVAQAGAAPIVFELVPGIRAIEHVFGHGLRALPRRARRFCRPRARAPEERAYQAEDPRRVNHARASITPDASSHAIPSPPRTAQLGASGTSGV
jgi:hypothetical protein